MTATRALRWHRLASTLAADLRPCNSQSWRGLRTISFRQDGELCYSLRVFTHPRVGTNFRARIDPGLWSQLQTGGQLAAAPRRSTMRSTLPGGSGSVACPSIEEHASQFLEFS